MFPVLYLYIWLTLPWDKRRYSRLQYRHACDEEQMKFTGVLVSPWPDQEGNKLMFLSEWREFPSAPCLAGKTTWWQPASRCCWNRARLWHASELVSFLVGLRIYQHSGKMESLLSVCIPLSHVLLPLLSWKREYSTKKRETFTICEKFQEKLLLE